MLRRPYSSTEPGVTLATSTQQKLSGEKKQMVVGAQVKNRRTLSAAPAYELNSGHSLRRSVNLPRNTALVPASAGEVVMPTHVHIEGMDPPSQEQTHLPLVQTEGEMRMQGAGGEMQIRVQSVRNLGESSSPLVHVISTGKSEIDAVTRLPNISPSSSPPHPKPNKISDTQLNSDGKREISKRVNTSVISIGEATSQDRPQGLRICKKRWLLGSKGGKLSLGWSHTKPIEPIAGHSVYHGRPDKGRNSQHKKHGGASLGRTAELQTAGEAAVSKDYIHIDVHEYLDNM